jgi:dUTP pyrophosphatase
MKKVNTKIELKNIPDEKVKIKIKKLNPDAIIPKYSHVGDAGMDLFSVEKDFILKPNHRVLVGTGLSIELPKGYVSLVWDKSGIALKGIKTMGGVIEHTYRGEYKIILVNLSSENYEIKKGQKIAQLLIQKIETAEIEEVDELSETTRGDGGFGSTGKF